MTYRAVGPSVAAPFLDQETLEHRLNMECSARDWDGKDYLRIIPRVVLVEDPRLT